MSGIAFTLDQCLQTGSWTIVHSQTRAHGIRRMIPRWARRRARDYRLFDRQGNFVGIIPAPRARPVLHRGAPTVYLKSS